VAVCTGISLPSPVHGSLPPPTYHGAASIPVFINSHPARAPPIFLPA
jgi:hypothetical protein